MTYIMLTPVKNEAHNIPLVIHSIINQTELPALWVIVDGGSTDGTLEIAQGFSRLYPRIVPIAQTNGSSLETSHQNVSLAIRQAYLFAIQYCTEHDIHYKYIWTIDGDQILEKNVCKGVIHKVWRYSLGAASGAVFTDNKADAYPYGELPNKRVYSKDAIDNIGGFPVSKYSYDTVILAKLRMQKWGIQSFPEYRITNLRADSGIERNKWVSHIQFGKARYYLGYSWPLLLLGCGYLTKQGKFGKAIGVFYGYLDSWIFCDAKIPDHAILQHFGKDRLKEVLK